MLYPDTSTPPCSPSALTSGCSPTGHAPSLFTTGDYSRLKLVITHFVSCRQLSRHLVGLWTAENPIALNLLKRILVSRTSTYCFLFKVPQKAQMSLCFSPPACWRIWTALTPCLRRMSIGCTYVTMSRSPQYGPITSRYSHISSFSPINN